MKTPQAWIEMELGSTSKLPTTGVTGYVTRVPGGWVVTHVYFQHMASVWVPELPEETVSVVDPTDGPGAIDG